MPVRIHFTYTLHQLNLVYHENKIFKITHLNSSKNNVICSVNDI